MNEENNVNEEKFVADYMELSGTPESFARCVYIFLEVAVSREDYPGRAWSSIGIESALVSNKATVQKAAVCSTPSVTDSEVKPMPEIRPLGNLLGWAKPSMTLDYYE